MFFVKHIKYVVIAALAIIATHKITTIYMNKQVEKLQSKLVQVQLEEQNLKKHYNEKIGNYQTIIATQTANLHNYEKQLNETKGTIRQLENQLNQKIEIISHMSVTIDSLLSAGQAAIEHTTNDTVIYTINETIQGTHLVVKLTHPGGNYVYKITYDPISMNIYITKTKNNIRIGAVTIPDRPDITITDWQLIYDKDTRTWYQRLWDNVHFNVGVVGGSDVGTFLALGYTDLSLGTMVTNNGGSALLMYTLK